MTCIGFAGAEAFDVILYIGRTLTKINYRVLIVDFSGTNALTCAIYHGMDLDSKEDIINYRDINYVQRVPSEEEFEKFKDGVVIVVYGYNYSNNFPLPLKQINIVTTPFPNSIMRANKLMREIVDLESNFGLLIRDIITLDDVDRVKEYIKMPVKSENTGYLYLDLNDAANAMNCQFLKVVRFINISGRMKKYIIDQIRAINPKLTQYHIKKAIRRAGRGN